MSNTHNDKQAERQDALEQWLDDLLDDAKVAIDGEVVRIPEHIQTDEQFLEFMLSD